MALKEETSGLITNLRSLKESNLKLNQVMEEMLEKIGGKNRDIDGLKRFEM